MKSDLKLIAMVAAGVLVAGYVMNQFRGTVDLINQAHAGFDSGIT